MQVSPSDSLTPDALGLPSIPHADPQSEQQSPQEQQAPQDPLSAPQAEDPQEEQQFQVHRDSPVLQNCGFITLSQLLLPRNPASISGVVSQSGLLLAAGVLTLPSTRLFTCLQPAANYNKHICCLLSA